jgi:hypothetical protein
MDRTPPTAALNPVSGIARGSLATGFSVTYTDATTPIDDGTFGDDDVIVTGPNGFSETATLTGVVPSNFGSPRTAIYQINAPGGAWTSWDNGTYTVTQLATSVSDTAGNSRPGGAAGEIGTFNVDIAFAWKVGSVLHVEHGPQGAPIHVAPTGLNVQATEGGTTLAFVDINHIVAHGSTGDDTLEYSGPLEAYTEFQGGAGDDTLRVRGGTFNFGDDMSLATPNLTVIVDAGAEAVFHTWQRLRGLVVNGTARLSQDSDYSVLTRGLSIGASGRLNLMDKDLIVDPAAGDPPVTAADVQAQIARAYNFSAWDGFGIATSMQAATVDALTTLACAPASEILFLSGEETAMWGGQTVSADAVLVKYTYAGDLTFDGLVDASDYGVIDNWVQFPGAGSYWNGDFNFDGVIDAGDYGIIDNTIQLQGDPL